MQVLPLWTNQFAHREKGVVLDTLVVHSMYHPKATDCFSPQLCQEWLNYCEVSAHYLIDRDGCIWQAVLEKHMAWHAGESQMPFADDQRQHVNQFSIGVELLATEISKITPAQYDSLAQLVLDIQTRHPLVNIVGHSDIAPKRKTDPWHFDWLEFQQALKRRGATKEYRLASPPK